MGMTDWVRRCGTQGRLTSISPPRMPKTRHPAHAVTIKNKSTEGLSEQDQRATEGRPESVHQLREADVGTVERGQGSTVESEPGQKDGSPPRRTRRVKPRAF